MTLLLSIYFLFLCLINIRQKSEANTIVDGNDTSLFHRSLQFEGMIDVNTQQGEFKKKSRRKKGLNKNVRYKSQLKILSKETEEIILNMDRYNQWWRGHESENKFYLAPWSSPHQSSSNAVFTMAVTQGGNNKPISSSLNAMHIFLGSLRRSYNDDIVLAIESNSLTSSMQSILKSYNVTVYVLPEDMCSRATHSIFCGIEEERVPASVFRYYLYEIWASIYSLKSFIMLADFHDVIFQGNPFHYQLSQWYPEFQLVLFKEFHPNMVISRCHFNRKIMMECYGDHALEKYGSRVVVSSGAALGTRDAIIVWSHSMTQQLQDSPGRMIISGSKCISGGIDHAFINWLVYSQSLVKRINIKLFEQGEGSVNTVGGLKPDTVTANLTGSLFSYWKLLDTNGRVLNWNGDISPVVHQLDHFYEELQALATHHEIFRSYLKDTAVTAEDRQWQIIASLRCLWGCDSSHVH